MRDHELREWYVEHGQRSGRFRAQYFGVTSRETRRRDVAPRLSAGLCRRVLARDGYRCRYCEIELVPLDVLKLLSRVLGAAVFRPVVTGNAGKHGAVLAFRANFDHVVPLAIDGPNDETNIVACCWSCNYGKRAFTLGALGIEDPRARPPVLDSWDGLRSEEPGLRRAIDMARLGPGAGKGAR